MGHSPSAFSPAHRPRPSPGPRLRSRPPAKLPTRKVHGSFSSRPGVPAFEVDPAEISASFPPPAPVSTLTEGAEARRDPRDDSALEEAGFRRGGGSGGAMPRRPSRRGPLRASPAVRTRAAPERALPGDGEAPGPRRGAPEEDRDAPGVTTLSRPAARVSTPTRGGEE
jgi:hypothetical protein